MMIDERRLKNVNNGIKKKEARKCRAVKQTFTFEGAKNDFLQNENIFSIKKVYLSIIFPRLSPAKHINSLLKHIFTQENYVYMNGVRKYVK